MNVAEAIAAVTAAEQQRAAKAAESDKYARFYKSRAWRAARYQFLKTLPRPLRCMICGATAKDAKVSCGCRCLVVDHVVSLKKDWSRRLDWRTNYQLIGNDPNLAKASSDQTDWRQS
ncbi:MAG: hypothetical protein WAK04_17200 [Xanthobacteraceae bacterium]